MAALLPYQVASQCGHAAVAVMIAVNPSMLRSYLVTMAFTGATTQTIDRPSIATYCDMVTR